MWARMDSNHRSDYAADLQSAPFGHSGTRPWTKATCNTYPDSGLAAALSPSRLEATS